MWGRVCVVRACDKHIRLARLRVSMQGHPSACLRTGMRSWLAACSLQLPSQDRPGELHEGLFMALVNGACLLNCSILIIADVPACKGGCAPRPISREQCLLCYCRIEIKENNHHSSASGFGERTASESGAAHNWATCVSDIQIVCQGVLKTFSFSCFALTAPKWQERRCFFVVQRESTSRVGVGVNSVQKPRQCMHTWIYVSCQRVHRVFVVQTQSENSRKPQTVRTFMWHLTFSLFNNLLGCSLALPLTHQGPLFSSVSVQGCRKETPL